MEQIKLADTPYRKDLVKLKKYKTQSFPEYNKNFQDLLGKLPFMQSKESFIKAGSLTDHSNIISTISNNFDEQEWTW